jgi:hypothetical protein
VMSPLMTIVRPPIMRVPPVAPEQITNRFASRPELRRSRRLNGQRRPYDINPDGGLTAL